MLEKARLHGLIPGSLVLVPLSLILHLRLEHGHSEYMNPWFKPLLQVRTVYPDNLLSYSAMAANRPRHSYSNIYTSDASRNHLGDVYNQYGPSPDQQAFRAVLDSVVQQYYMLTRSLYCKSTVQFGSHARRSACRAIRPTLGLRR
jgi:hypothetical protein